jgi:hypothetical protein
MSIVGRNPPPEPGKPIHYCGTCGRGSTAGPCPEHEAPANPKPEHPGPECRPIPRPRPGSREEIEMGRDCGPEPGDARGAHAGVMGPASPRWGLSARTRTAVAAARQLEAEAG